MTIENSHDSHSIKMQFSWDGMNIGITKHQFISQRKIEVDITILSVNLVEVNRYLLVILLVRISGMVMGSV